VIGRTEVVSAAVELIEKGGQTDKMTHSKKGWLLSRQNKQHLTDQCVMVSLTVHLGMSAEAFVGDHVDTTAEDLQNDPKEQGLMNSRQREHSMVAIVHGEVDIAGGVVTVPVLETAVKEQMQMMLRVRTMVVLTMDKGGKHQIISREIEEDLVNGKNGKDLMKMWKDQKDQDSMTEEVAESLFVVAEVVGVDLAEVGEVSIDLERETMIDILKGMFISVFTFHLL